MGDEPFPPGLVGEGLVLRRPVLALNAVLINPRTARCGDLLIRSDSPVTALCGALAALHPEYGAISLQVRDAAGAAVAFIGNIREGLGC